MGDYCPAGSGEAGEEEEDFIKIDIPKERRDQGVCVGGMGVSVYV